VVFDLAKYQYQFVIVFSEDMNTKYLYSPIMIRIDARERFTPLILYFIICSKLYYYTYTKATIHCIIAFGTLRCPCDQ